MIACVERKNDQKIGHPFDFVKQMYTICCHGIIMWSLQRIWRVCGSDLNLNKIGGGGGGGGGGEEEAGVEEEEEEEYFF